MGFNSAFKGLKAFKITIAYITILNNIVDGYGHFEGIWCLLFHRRGKYLRYITPEPVRLQSQQVLINKLIICVCLVCLHAVLVTLLRSARN